MKQKLKITVDSAAKEVRAFMKANKIKRDRNDCFTDEKWNKLPKGRKYRVDGKNRLTQVFELYDIINMREYDKLLEKHPEMHTFGGFCEVLFGCDVNGKPLKKKKK